MSVELFVYFGVGMLLLGVIITFVYEWNFKDQVETFENLYEDPGDIKFETKVDKIEFITAAKIFWDYCNHSYVNKSRILYVYNNKTDNIGSLTKKDMFDQYKSIGWCKNIQSSNFSCGKREDVNMTDITLPKVVRIDCLNKTLFIR